MRAAEADILIAPGYSGGTKEHWHGRWMQKLSTAQRVEQQDWLTPRRDAWVDALVAASTRGHRPVVFVAHSLGAVALLHAAPRLGAAVVGAFLVAPPDETALRDMIEGYDPESAGAPLPDGRHIDPAFLSVPRARLPFPAIMVGSRNDPYARADFAPALAADLGAKFIDAGDAGHINVDSGHGPWPEGLLAFAHFLSRL